MNIFWSDGKEWKSVQSRALLNTKLVEFEERDVTGLFWTKEDFYKEYPNQTLPLIIFDDEVIGGWDELFNYYKWYP
jgi:glutaredoxin